MKKAFFGSSKQKGKGEKSRVKALDDKAEGSVASSKDQFNSSSHGESNLVDVVFAVKSQSNDDSTAAKKTAEENATIAAASTVNLSCPSAVEHRRRKKTVQTNISHTEGVESKGSDDTIRVLRANKVSKKVAIREALSKEERKADSSNKFFKLLKKRTVPSDYGTSIVVAIMVPRLKKQSSSNIITRCYSVCAEV